MNEQVCVHECLFLRGRERECLCAARIHAHIYTASEWRMRQIRHRQICVLFSVAALEREVLPVGGKRFIFEYQWLFVESVI